METFLKTGFAQIFSCCPKKRICPKFGGAAAPLAPPARTPMLIYGEKFAFQNRLASLIVESKFTVFALFYFVLEGNFPSRSPQAKILNSGFWPSRILTFQNLEFRILTFQNL